MNTTQDAYSLNAIGNINEKEFFKYIYYIKICIFTCLQKYSIKYTKHTDAFFSINKLIDASHFLNTIMEFKVIETNNLRNKSKYTCSEFQVHKS